MKEKEQGSSATTDTRGFDFLAIVHLQNFADGIRLNTPLCSPICEAAVSTMLCHPGNISQFENASLVTDNTIGNILNNQDAISKRWKRQYEKSWEPMI